MPKLYIVDPHELHGTINIHSIIYQEFTLTVASCISIILPGEFHSNSFHNIKGSHCTVQGRRL